jgi:hypothetical protein
MRAIEGGNANDINDSGQVVGNYFIGQGARRAMGPYGLLQDQLDGSGAGWLLEEAYGINEAGQIVGGGWGPYGYHAFLLTPVPEPSAFITFAGLLGAGLMCRMWRRRTLATSQN